jgi:hypothetical protein
LLEYAYVSIHSLILAFIQEVFIIALQQNNFGFKERKGERERICVLFLTYFVKIQIQNRHANVMQPRLINAFRNYKEEVEHISLTSCVTWDAHTFAITKSNRLYGFGSGDKGQLGVDMPDGNYEKCWPELINIDLS